MRADVKWAMNYEIYMNQVWVYHTSHIAMAEGAYTLKGLRSAIM